MRACAGPFCGIWLLLSVTPPALAGLSVPAITGQPQSQTVPQGSEVTLSVTASGDDLVYQWWLNGAAIPSATNDTYVVNNMQPSDAGDYHVAISGNVDRDDSTHDLRDSRSDHR